MARPKYPQIILVDFTKGLHTNIPDRSYQPNETPDCLNIDFYPKGAISKRTGYFKEHSTSMDGSGSPIIYLDQFYTTAGTDYLYGFTAMSAGCGSASIYDWNSSTKTWTHVGSSVIGSAWTPLYTDHIITETFADCLIAVNGTSDSPIYSSGGGQWAMLPVSAGATYVIADTKDSAGVAISACIPAVSVKGFKNYLFIANTLESGTTYGSRIRWSDLEDPFAWPAYNYIDLDPNDGDSIVGMEVLGDSLIVFKEKKIYSIAYIGGIYLFDSEIRVDGRGLASPQSLAQIYTNLIFLSEDGFYAFDGHDIKELSSNLKDVVVGINPSNRSIVQAAPLEDKNQLWFICPSGASNICDVAFVYDYVQQNWTLNTLSASSIGFYYVTADLTLGDLTETWESYSETWDARTSLANTSVMIIGTYPGIMGQMGTSTADGGAAIDSHYRTPWIDMDEPERTKRIMRITFFVQDEGTNDYGLKWYLRTDWKDSQTPVISGVIPLSGSIPGNMIEDRIDLSRQARSFQLEFKTTGAYQPWRVFEIHIDYVTKGTANVDGSLS